MCRSEGSLSQEIRKKIALFASLPPERDRLGVRRGQHLQGAARLPRTGGRRLHPRPLRHGGAGEPDLSSWQEPIERAERASRTVRIALVGKYVQLEDAYLSVSEALRHAAALQDARVQIDWVDSEHLEPGAAAEDPAAGERARQLLHGADGILIPGGFGGRGIEGKIAAARIAREQRIPYLGICLGMQIAVAEFARHVAGMEGANSTEFDLETPLPGDRPAARAEGGRRPRRHDAPGRGPDQAARGLARAGDLRRGGHLRAPPPPL